MTTTTRRDAHRPAAAPGHAGRKADHLARLSKIEGQIRGISRMAAEDRCRIDVLTRISATRALQEVALGLLEDHVRGCVTRAARTGPVQAEGESAELTDTLRRALRL
ncbi:copper-sensing transcriptional repressor RicR [Streptomyces ruber]|uniref:Copper-sensing transcriptional repressor RicR n=2 Tax=Streptomyces TaxID=1883 RepID=A0A918BRY8_9ACTN|nr:metal-sensitive transcriptional regulator [Streptomyces ruber]GGQ88758.1 copper-sensing transcriptional repressor RicR [Streptomyces ruber]